MTHSPGFGTSRIGTAAWSHMRAPTPGRSMIDWMPSASNSRAGPTPERIKIAGDPMEPAQSVTLVAFLNAAIDKLYATDPIALEQEAINRAVGANGHVVPRTRVG